MGRVWDWLFGSKDLPKGAEFNRASGWEEFKGNELTVERLQRIIEAARIQKSMLPNTLIYGPAGCGKTTLANIVTEDWGASYIGITGSSLSNQLDLVKLALKIKALNKKGRKVIVFIDEIHGIVKGRGLSEDIWLPILEDGILHHSCEGKSWKEDGYKHIAPASPIELEGVTWLGATTDPGLLHDAVRRRFPVTITLEDYTKADIASIVNTYCKREGITIEPTALSIISDRARYRPAIAIQHLLRQARDEAIIEAKSVKNILIVEEHVLEASRLAGVHEGGLRNEDIKVLEALYETYPNGIGLSTLAGTTDMAVNIVHGMVLPFLQTEGLVKTTQRRFLTEKGKAFVETKLHNN